MKPDGASGSEKFETAEKFEDDAYVLYTYSESAEEVKSVALAEEATGTVSKVVNNTNDQDKEALTINDTEYKASKMASSLLSAISVDLDYTIYLDTYGYVIYVERGGLQRLRPGSGDRGFQGHRLQRLPRQAGPDRRLCQDGRDLSKDYKNDKSIDQ
ncbi:hypothetical protein [Dysosmobacter welbionis]|uniref:hypothetical protein n=1 Tax=Dysosmobacter welbionis TaxID=2093857 RepID=UPI00300F0039